MACVCVLGFISANISHKEICTSDLFTRWVLINVYIILGCRIINIALDEIYHPQIFNYHSNFGVCYAQECNGLNRFNWMRMRGEI